jgi:hypothetical protein
MSVTFKHGRGSSTTPTPGHPALPDYQSPLHRRYADRVQHVASHRLAASRLLDLDSSPAASSPPFQRIKAWNQTRKGPVGYFACGIPYTGSDKDRECNSRRDGRRLRTFCITAQISTSGAPLTNIWIRRHKPSRLLVLAHFHDAILLGEGFHF